MAMAMAILLGRCHDRGRGCDRGRDIWWLSRKFSFSYFFSILNCHFPIFMGVIPTRLSRVHTRCMGVFPSRLPYGCMHGCCSARRSGLRRSVSQTEIKSATRAEPSAGRRTGLWRFSSDANFFSFGYNMQDWAAA